MCLRSVYAAWAAAQTISCRVGDLARNLSQNKCSRLVPQLPASTVIDNDNLAQATEMPGKQGRSNPTGLFFPLIGQQRNQSIVARYHVQSSFNARASALLVRPILVEDLPLGELLSWMDPFHPR